MSGSLVVVYLICQLGHHQYPVQNLEEEQRNFGGWSPSCLNIKEERNTVQHGWRNEDCTMDLFRIRNMAVFARRSSASLKDNLWLPGV
mmetsp:Transcript_39644/g.51151  ORF Transcript_39644/g.51151 Transcript_39644/m.51151 type:complete len:88 (+) Transcript_39644:464-727(+)